MIARIGLAVGALLASCGEAPAPSTNGTSHSVVQGRYLELNLRDSHGRDFRLSELRGRPVVLLLFTTFDDVSPFAFRVAERLSSHHPEATFVGITVQPRPAEILRAFAEASGAPFTLAFVTDDALLRGESSLGQIPGVPMFVFVDRTGRAVTDYVGFAEEAELAKKLDVAKR